MLLKMKNSNQRHPVLVTTAALALALSLSGAASAQGTYSSPQEAVDALVASVKSGSVADIVAVLGPEGQGLASSGDPVADASVRERFVSAYDEAHQLHKFGDEPLTLYIGHEDFPFPIPLVEEAGKWHFDTAAGAEEILDRRIGENELAAIQVLRSSVDAQREYAETDHDGKGVQYARRLLSSEGKMDGLYWPTAEGEPESPLGPLVAEARSEGYKARQGGPTPYHGYFFRVLSGQGKDAAGGARDYIVHGRMIGGFGLIAVPAEYANSGVMTFIVNQDGVVYQKDLGPRTGAIASGITAFDPDTSWSQVLD
ncbi:DUF2950 domain-containing protein [Hyphomicrobium sp.]|uniref:DUF2950 domain-containing protein n=1 Tax=Hyphomicrobium sp. TaxID=82 RepID=UPI002E322D7F|nr:DUF2950 domain-containing protein [Hyphomicrobium sp.]HEX2842887.1 DUF2950 domain-containing protein [Hyphomicrobium sp.]